ncbi:MAG TPA: FAD/NAD(P)-binding oxidoreductase [Solirubrobacteraceae bacterium]|nr:FAD/NAD(P)-binding oxidoreductase [Solirubrobacteraceae bacterium]
MARRTISKPTICIVGAGTAALEGLLCARQRFGADARLRLIAPDSEFRYRPMSLRSPFRPAREQALAIGELVAQAGGTWTRARADFVEDSQRTVITRDGDVVDYDFLLLAPGGRAARTLRGGYVWQRGGDPGVLDRVIAGLAAGDSRSVAVTVPRGARWPLPAYELALVLAWTTAGSGARIVLLTAEEQPLHALGAKATALVVGELREAGVETVTGVEVMDQPTQDRELGAAADVVLLREELEEKPDPLTATPSDPARVRLSDGSQAEFDHLISLPTIIGPVIAGVPTDAAGFIEVDAALRVCASERIWAVGGCIAAALEHSALSACQADAAIAAIAAVAREGAAPRDGVPNGDGTSPRDGAPAGDSRSARDGAHGRAAAGEPQASRPPELTGVLLRGQRGRWLAENPPGTREPSTRCLWWPPGRAVGRMLAERIAAWNPSVDSTLSGHPDGLVVRVPIALGCSGRETAATSTPVSADVRTARLQDIDNRQLLAIRRRERDAEAELRSLSAGLRELAAGQRQTIRELQRHGYLRDRAVGEGVPGGRGGAG